MHEAPVMREVWTQTSYGDLKWDCSHDFKLCEQVGQIVCRAEQPAVQWVMPHENHAMLIAPIVVLIGLLSVVVPAAVRAAPAPPPALDRSTATVSVADLDLNTREGAQIARKRVRRAAIALCRKYSDPRRASDRETMADCVREAIHSARVRAPVGRS